MLKLVESNTFMRNLLPLKLWGKFFWHYKSVNYLDGVLKI